MFPLGFEAHQAASRCSEGAEEVLSFVANLRSEDSLTHVILIFLHKEFGTKPFAHFPSLVWGHWLWVGQWETRLAGISYRWPRIPKYLPQFLISPSQLFRFLWRLFHGDGGNFRSSGGVSCNSGPSHHHHHHFILCLQLSPKVCSRIQSLF